MSAWSDTETEILSEVVDAHHGNLKLSAQVVSRIFGRHITAKAVDSRLRRAGLRVATTTPVVQQFAEIALLIPDCHVPFQNKRALDVLHKAAALLKPTTIAILGDFADMYSVSFHPKNPNVHESLKSEVDAVNVELDRFDRHGATRKIYIHGNHEFRLNRYLNEKAPALFGAVDCDSLFKLKERGWESVQYTHHTKVGKLFLTHDTGVAGPTAHVKAGATFEHSVVIGHVHRINTHYFGNATGETHVAASLGWLGDRDQIDYMHPIKVYKDWSLGFGIAYIEPNGITHLQAVPIIDYKCVVNGQLVVG